MEDNEDEPDDVKQATPVQEEITKGETDEHSGKPTAPIELAKKRHHCEKDRAKISKKPPNTKEECCRAKLAKAARAPKTQTVLLYDKECTLPKIKCIPRHCLSKDQWIDILATPKRRCPPPCFQREVTRKVRPVSTRIAELARPPKTRLFNTLQDRAGTLPIELVDNLVQTLEGDACLTPEQAERMFRDKDIQSRKKCRKRKSKLSCKENKPSKGKEPGNVPNASLFDKEAVNCQYMMAESFVKSILEWKTPIPKEEFKDIAEVILKRLGYVLEYNPVKGEDRKSQQMRFLADIVASWISGVLFDVAEAQKAELEEECEKKRKEIEEESEEESDEESEEEPEEGDDDEPKKPKKKKEKEGKPPKKKKKDDKDKKGDGDGKDDEDDDDDKKGGAPGQKEGKGDADGGDTQEKPTDDGKVEGEQPQSGPDDLTPDDAEEPQEMEETPRDEDGTDGTKEQDDEDKPPEEAEVKPTSETEDGAKEDAEEPPKEDAEAKPKEDAEAKPKEDAEAKPKEPDEPKEETMDQGPIETSFGDEPEKFDPDSSPDAPQIAVPEGDEISKPLDEAPLEKIDEPSIIEEKTEAAVDVSESLPGTQEIEATEDKIPSEEAAVDEAITKPETDDKAGDKTDESPTEQILTTGTETSESKEKDLDAGDVDKEVHKDLSHLDETERMIDKVSGLKSKGSIATKVKSSKIPSLKTGSGKIKKFQTDTPFVTFDKIFHTIYNAIEASRENPGEDAITNRIHRAVYEKCSNVVQEEKSGPLGEVTKDVLDVLSGKIALWLREVLNESQLAFINKFPATVESCDVREWTKWIAYVSDTANTWSTWIQQTIRQAEAMRSGKITRGDWQDWTKSVGEDAVLWRRFYVESLHQAHQNLTMIRDRRVVKTGDRILPGQDNEKEMKITDLETK